MECGGLTEILFLRCAKKTLSQRVFGISRDIQEISAGNEAKKKLKCKLAK